MPAGRLRGTESAEAAQHDAGIFAERLRIAVEDRRGAEPDDSLEDLDDRLWLREAQLSQLAADQAGRRRGCELNCRQLPAHVTRKGDLCHEPFLVIYDRQEGQIIRHRGYKDPRRALRARFAAEREFRGQREIEVVVLGADSWESLPQTHARYFQDVQGLAATALDRGLARP
jgi:hypothetical protein